MAKSKKVKGRGIKLTWENVEAIRKRSGEGEKVDNLAGEFKVHVSTIRSIIAERTWRGRRPHGNKGRKPANAIRAEKARKAKSVRRGGKPLSINLYNKSYEAYCIFNVPQQGAAITFLSACSVS